MISRSSIPHQMSGGIASYGRNGDTMLMHVNPQEVQALSSMVPGGLTINPHTGNPEAFKLWPILAGLAAGGIGSLLFPFLAPALGLGAAAGGAGAAGAAGTAAGLGAGTAASALPAAAMAASPMTAATMAATAAPTAAAGLAAAAPAAAPSAIPGMLGTVGKGIGSFMGSKWALPTAFMAANMADQAGWFAPKEKKKKKEEDVPRYELDRQANYDPYGNFQGYSGGYNYLGTGPYDRPSYQPMYMSGGGQVKARCMACGGPLNSECMKCGGRVKGMAGGGLVEDAPFNPIQAGIASLSPPGGGASATRQMDKEIVQQAIMSLTGQIPSEEPINVFVARFGKPALADLAQRVFEQDGQQTEGMRISGPGDGMTDSISAQAGAQPIQLSDGEFVIPSSDVSAIGNGSTDAGAKELQNMIRRIRKEKNGSTQQPPAIDPKRYMPI